MNKLVPIEEVAEYCGVSLSTVRNWLRNGTIPKDIYMKVGKTIRFDLELVLNYLMNYKEEEKESEHEKD